MIPVIRLEHLTPEQARAFSIADNRLAETSSWDDRLLAEVFRDLASVHLTSISRRRASRWAKSICGSKACQKQPLPVPIPPMNCARTWAKPLSAGRAISGSLVRIGSFAATRSIKPLTTH